MIPASQKLQVSFCKGRVFLQWRDARVKMQIHALPIFSRSFESLCCNKGRVMCVCVFLQWRVLCCCFRRGTRPGAYTASCARPCRGGSSSRGGTAFCRTCPSSVSCKCVGRQGRSSCTVGRSCSACLWRGLESVQKLTEVNRIRIISYFFPLT